MYINKEIMRNRALTEERLKAHTMKIEQARAKAKAEAEKIKSYKEFRIPKVGDLLYHIATNRLAYCDGINDDGYFIMSFPGENVPHEYAKHEIISNFRY